jgi:hypothetical protein
LQYEKNPKLMERGYLGHLHPNECPPAAGKKQCKPLCASTEEVRRLTGNNWQKIYWNVLLPKKSKKRSCVTRQGNTMRTMPQIKKKHQNQDQREKIK